MAHMIEQPGAAVSRLCKGRLHDFRHTFATHLAENGVSESTMFALINSEPVPVAEQSATIG